jgi:hypothetical protein|tara:strand:- start:400 stop:705 length:306 start_codon:yes stop_codon:yes gene_type:complete
MKDNIFKVKFSKSLIKGKKMTAIFYDKNNKKIKTTHFGAEGASDFTINKDDKRKQSYLDRHRAREDWNNPITAGALSRWILWESTSKTQAIKDFKKRFNLV